MCDFAKRQREPNIELSRPRTESPAVARPVVLTFGDWTRPVDGFQRDGYLVVP